MRRSLLHIKLIRQKDPEKRAKIKEQIKGVDQYLLSCRLPKNLDPHDNNNYLYTAEKQFETLCTRLESLGVHQPKRLTVFEFYSRISYFKEENKPKTTK